MRMAISLRSGLCSWVWGFWSLMSTLLVVGAVAIPAWGQVSDIDDAVSEAVSYLLAQQGEDGVWGAGDQSLHTTVEVVLALKMADRAGITPASASGDFGVIPAAIDEAYGAFAGLDPDDLERQTLVASLRIAAGRNIGSLRTTILDQQQADGGWGITIEHRSSVRDTIMVAEALLGEDPIPIADDRLLAAIGFLDSELRSVSGSQAKYWLHGAGGESGVMTSARGLIALRRLGETLGSESAIYDARRDVLAYLLSEVEPDMNWSGATPWSDPDGDTAIYATTLRAYAGARQPRELERMISGFLGRVSLDGSWAANGVPSFGSPSPDAVYPTAAMIRALLSVPETLASAESELPDIWIA
ncbi:MAG: hypothetical protein KC996_09390, partial [Phycisphaerales bacterium]|nr:hypothetical protein [Phycisphaerales bacterium]